MSACLTTLPDEVLQLILSYLPPRTTLAVQQTCRRFANVTNEPLLWKEYCQHGFRWWHRRHQIREKLQDTSYVDWKPLFARRHTTTLTTHSAIDKIISKEFGRLDWIRVILDAGYDAKDGLLDLFRTASSSPNHLAQKYWSHAALGCLQRYIAAQAWIDPRMAEVDPNFLERSLAALDLFVLEERTMGDLDDIFDRLDSYVSSVRDAHPKIDDLSPRQKAPLIADHLLKKRWVGIQGGRDYHSLDHMFLGVALFSGNRNSVPLISAVIFCYVARQFRLRASPCNFPLHVYALVQPPAGLDLDGHPLPESGQDAAISQLTHLYMDPFNSSEPVSLASLETRLRFIAPTATATNTASYLSAAYPQALTIRTAFNILSSGDHYSGAPLEAIERNLASYGAVFSLVLLPSLHQIHPIQWGQHLAELTQHFLDSFDLDVHLFESLILPLTSRLPDSRAYRNLIYSRKESDQESRPPKFRRDPRNAVVRFSVGQIFRHRRRGYLAVVCGWDPYCRMQEQWITMNQVDRLPNGRNQPFYSAFVQDRSTRYVAEENIELLEHADISQDVVDAFPIEVGKWFKRYDADAGRFTSNVRDEYPED